MWGGEGSGGAWITMIVTEGIMSYLTLKNQIEILKIYTLFINCARNK